MGVYRAWRGTRTRLDTADPEGFPMPSRPHSRQCRFNTLIRALTRASEGGWGMTLRFALLLLLTASAVFVLSQFVPLR